MAVDRNAPRMQRVPLETKSLAEYGPVVGQDVIGEIEVLARPLRGARVVHVSATAQGGGVAELLYTLVPLMRAVGLDAEWRVIAGSEAFFEVTKSLHNGLQGMPLDLTADMRARYLEWNSVNAAAFDGDYDFVVVHDPQPAPLRAERPDDAGKWVWRCHIDLTAAIPEHWSFLRPFIQLYDAAIFTMPDYVMPDLNVGTIAIIPPAIDPLSTKNAPLPQERVIQLIGARRVDPSRLLLVQVSRFDPWKDPLGAIEVYRAVRHAVPGIQLVLLGALAQDDPEGEEYYRRTLEAASNDPDIHVLLNDGGNVEVNAFQRHASVILQKSLREGFGLTVTEGLWKARPVVASKVGGIPMQIVDGISGYLVEGVEECAQRILDIFRDQEDAAAIGRHGREVVRRHFLSTTNLRHYLQLFTTLLGRAA
ncbi:MAG TPA: glycosyltransferase [Ktedonobacterales bacterium]|jgi:trehalose synthase|nr:glycosyltransferase [Ktedonobacterales bacterium]